MLTRHNARHIPSLLTKNTLHYLEPSTQWMFTYYVFPYPFVGKAPDSVLATEFTFLSGCLTPSMLPSSLSFQGAWLSPCYRVHFPFRKYESDINQNVTNCQPESFVCPDFYSNLCLMITIACNQHGIFMKSVLNRKGWWQYLTNKLIPRFEVKLPHLFHKRTGYIIVMHIDSFKAWYLSFSSLQDIKGVSESNFADGDFHFSLVYPPLLSCEHCKHVYCSRLVILLLPTTSEK
jgi:hypothetical protein